MNKEAAQQEINRIEERLKVLRDIVNALEESKDLQKIREYLNLHYTGATLYTIRENSKQICVKLLPKGGRIHMQTAIEEIQKLTGRKVEELIWDKETLEVSFS